VSPKKFMNSTSAPEKDGETVGLHLYRGSCRYSGSIPEKSGRSSCAGIPRAAAVAAAGAKGVLLGVVVEM
jgi:hypothetical protein